MNIDFSQIYIVPGAEFPFTHIFQEFLSREMTKAVTASDKFIKSYGPNFKIIFIISAKTNIVDNEIKGPAVFRKTADVEYSIFLPFDAIVEGAVDDEHVLRLALQFLFKGVFSVLESLDIHTEVARKKQDFLIEKICSDPSMFAPDDEDAVWE